MRFPWLAGLALVACGQPHPTKEPVIVPAITPRLSPPPPIVDLDAPDAPYRVAVALQLQPGWAQFLDDCRLRLPSAHPLNAMALTATAEFAVDALGRVVEIHLDSSGNADYDRAVRQLIEDAAPLPRPPRALWADDDLVHVRWLFARDRRQAGPATASVVPHDLPVRDVVARFAAAGDLARAAQRIRREPSGMSRDAATHVLMTAALREALASSDATVRRSAVAAIGRAGLRDLASTLRDLLTSTSDVELQVAIFDANATLGDHATVAIALDRLRTDVVDEWRLANAEVFALVQLGASAQAASVLLDHFDRMAKPDPLAVLLLAPVSVPELVSRLVRWYATGDARLRSAICSALSSQPGRDAAAAILHGLRDRDAHVRTNCTDAIVERPDDARPAIARLRELARDRDELVRASAIRALGDLDPGSLVSISPDRRASEPSARRTIEIETDRSAYVRATYARALARGAVVAGGESAIEAEAHLRVLLDDRDADVRAAAWQAWSVLPAGPSTHGARASLALKASTDPASQVRTQSLRALDDDAALTRLATTDDDPETRTAAMVALAGRRGRAASADLLLQRLADATPGSAERVRTALAWLLAR